MGSSMLFSSLKSIRKLKAIRGQIRFIDFRWFLYDLGDLNLLISSQFGTNSWISDAMDQIWLIIVHILLILGQTLDNDERVIHSSPVGDLTAWFPVAGRQRVRKKLRGKKGGGSWVIHYSHLIFKVQIAKVKVLKRLNWLVSTFNCSLFCRSSMLELVLNQRCCQMNFLG